VLSVRDLRVGYGDVRVLHGVSLEVGAGEIVSLVGANGAGKTTTLRTISGLLRAAGGEIRWDGRPITGLRPAAIVELGIVQIPEGRRIFPELTVLENLLVGGINRRVRRERPARLARVWQLFPVLRERLRQRGGTLSGGEQQMLAIGRGLMAGPRLLMLDEPSLGLAPLMVDTLFDAIRTISARGVTILLVEQNVQRALTLAHRGYVLENGEIRLQGPGPALLADPDVRRAYLGI
jgi:branched-chain amino acid transport system ATP-binding protein